MFVVVVVVVVDVVLLLLIIVWLGLAINHQLSVLQAIASSECFPSG